MGNLQSAHAPTKKLTPRFLFDLTARMYEDGNAYPFARMLARYRGLCILGTKSLAYAQSLGELLTNGQIDLDPAIVQTIVLDVVLRVT
jgi:hypothetical protein